MDPGVGRSECASLEESNLLRLWWDADGRDLALEFAVVGDVFHGGDPDSSTWDPLVVYLIDCVCVRMHRALDRAMLQCPSPMPLGPSLVELVTIREIEGGILECIVALHADDMIRVVCRHVLFCRHRQQGGRHEP